MGTPVIPDPGAPAGPAGPAGPGGPTNVGMAANVAATLCYVPVCCLNIVWAVYVVVVEKQSRFLRFHAFQSLLFSATLIVISIPVYLLGAISQSAILSGMLSFALGIVALGGSIFLAIKAYSGEEFELPQLGKMARDFAAK